MNARGSVCLLLLSIHGLTLLAGCKSVTRIDVSEVPNIESGREVRTEDGSRLEVKDSYNVELVPAEGWLLMHPEDDLERTVSVPEHGEEDAESRGFTTLRPIDGPIRASIEGDSLQVRAQHGTVVVPFSSVSAVELRQYSPGKTAGLVAGVTAGGVAFGVLLYVALSLAGGER